LQVLPRAVLISTYELGRQPFGLASPAAWLRQAGWDVDCFDLAKERLRDEALASASLIAFHLPMHTATRLAGGAIAKARRINPSATLCAYGLYAPPNAAWLSSLGVNEVLGAEYEEALTAIARALSSHGQGSGERPAQVSEGAAAVHQPVPRIRFLVPDRRGLLPLERYASLHMSDGSRRTIGSTEASRGCKHQCRHCPIVPIYQGQFRIVQPEVVLADIAAQVAQGAQHITFGDPDFLNGPRHAMRVVELLHASHPTLSYDVTIKIEHLLQHRDLLDRLRETGCLFVTSAVESLDDAVLARLQKGHTRADFLEAVALCRSVGLTLIPTFVAFHPWLTLEGYCDLLDTIESLELVEHVAPIQLAIRLLIPEGSKLLEIEDTRGILHAFDPATLTYPWRHADARVDELQRQIASLVGIKAGSERRTIFDEVSALAHAYAGVTRTITGQTSRQTRVAVPYVNEPWYCCAEPNPEQVTLV
jgi:radical SAM family protein